MFKAATNQPIFKADDKIGLPVGEDQVPRHYKFMDTWSPLFASLIRSSVWGLPLHVRVVWVTMIALKDKNGFVAGSVPGLARFSAVSEEQCDEALMVFLSPDKRSTNPDHDGRKIKAVEGGWIVLGHERFQKKMKEVSTQIGNAKRQRAYRDRNKENGKKPVKPKTAPAEIASYGGPTERSFEQAVADGDQARADEIVTGSLPASCNPQ